MGVDGDFHGGERGAAVNPAIRQRLLKFLDAFVCDLGVGGRESSKVICQQIPPGKEAE